MTTQEIVIERDGNKKQFVLVCPSNDNADNQALVAIFGDDCDWFEAKALGLDDADIELIDSLEIGITTFFTEIGDADGTHVTRLF